MRSFRRWAHSSVITMFVLALPLSQAQAQDCVQFSGLTHCAVGGARLMVQGKELTAHVSDTSGMDGVAIETLGAKTWSAGQTCDPSGTGEDITVTTFEAGGKVVATSTVTERSDEQTFAATFVDADGEPTTFSAFLYSKGKLVDSVRGLPSGTIAAQSVSHSLRPTCTTVSRELCYQMCIGGGGPLACPHCEIPCRRDAGNVLTLSNGAIPHLSMSFKSPSNGVTLGHAVKLSEPVVGDELVLIADAPSAGAAQDVDVVTVQSTAKNVTLSGESTTHR
ncbi:hypothetical protein [Pyxidicoccus xibeiensis]|uniref:hypothetical protein n=1 Tax=Pyxidicoccus xibeiensis TaxID=2906759 RepID=UPI0020A74D3B|nr:hypothetical protein [Pyxidicoccus xibeiensis]MCP3141941.1 hypothetical protein [Pyxidicoccus xibeiensis]